MEKGKGIYFIQFTNNVTEDQLEGMFPQLEKTYWYERKKNFDLLKFEIKNKRITAGKFYIKSYILVISGSL